MNKLIFATHNSNKVKEVRELLSDSFEILGLNDIGFNEDIIEDKLTIMENSILLSYPPRLLFLIKSNQFSNIEKLFIFLSLKIDLFRI